MFNHRITYRPLHQISYPKQRAKIPINNRLLRRIHNLLHLLFRKHKAISRRKLCNIIYLYTTISTIRNICIIPRSFPRKNINSKLESNTTEIESNYIRTRARRASRCWDILFFHLYTSKLKTEKGINLFFRSTPFCIFRCIYFLCV